MPKGQQQKIPEEDGVRKDTAVVSSTIRGTEQLSLAGPSRSNIRLCGSARKRSRTPNRPSHSVRVGPHNCARTNNEKATSIKCVQINLHRAKSASAALSERFVKSGWDIALIQEPWAHNGKISGLPGGKATKRFFCSSCDRPRTAIMCGRDTIAFPLHRFITRDLTAVSVEFGNLQNGKGQIVLASAYFPGDEEHPPPQEIKDLVEHCRLNNLKLIVACDANAHHIAWGSSDTNGRGEEVLQYIFSKGLLIANRGVEPTFVNAIRQEVLDLTIVNRQGAELIMNWHVSNQASLSDHRYIRFDIEALRLREEYTRIPKKTDWGIFKALVHQELIGLPKRVKSTEEVDLLADQFQVALIQAYEESCPITTIQRKKDVPWWNSQLGKLRRNLRKLFNRAKATQQWEAYKKALTEYNKELRRSKRESWKKFCEEIGDTPRTSRLQKALSKDHNNGIGSLKHCDGSYSTNTKETLEILLKAHFPLCDFAIEKPDVDSRSSGTPVVLNRDYRFAKKIITEAKVEWAVKSFKPFKAPGGDGIFPALLQQSLESTKPLLTEIFRASLCLGYIPKAWRLTKAVFIPKAGNKPPGEAKSYRPISLTSFLLKTLEKIIDNYIRTTSLKSCPLNANQYAYQPGKSTEDALSSLVGTIERAFEDKEVALCSFMDIQGAFDNTLFDSIRRVTEERGIDTRIVRWIGNMLEKRCIIATLNGESTTIRATRGCPQGGVLSPLLWLLVVDELLSLLQEAGFKAQGYADDIVICVKGKFDSVLPELMQTALNTVTRWCQKMGLSINPGKTVLVPFTRKRSFQCPAPRLNGLTLEYSKEAKYLGVILDSRLTWNSHLKMITDKALWAFNSCQRLFGKKWGLNPKMTLWIYLGIIRPILSYGANVWWPKTMQSNTRKTLDKVQRIACLGATGAFASCPQRALEAILGLLPLYLFIKREAAASMLRRRRSDVHNSSGVGHLNILEQVHIEDLEAPTDVMAKRFSFERGYQVTINERNQILDRGLQFPQQALVWYTDGSRKDNKTGAGVVGPEVELSIPLGASPSIFQAEVYAIEVGAQESLNRGCRNSNIYICSDSQAALLALSSQSFESRLVWSCHTKLQLLSRDNRVTLLWVPGHEGVEGNEKADGLAKTGADNPYTGPYPTFGLPKSHFRGELRKWEARQLNLLWRNAPGMKQAKEFFIPSPLQTRKLTSLSRQSLRLFVNAVTGHGPFRHFLRKIGRSDSELCRLCEEEDETSKHIICECPALANLRRQITGGAFLAPNKVCELSPTAIIELVKRLDIA